MAWPWKILLFQFCVTMGFALVFYIIWRLAHPGKKWQVRKKENEGGNFMPILDIAIASYLCGIMGALGIIIVIGLLMQKAKNKK